jgi:2-keto-4-pentenoate hydratase/2-oxohepta-3-ene-1,7-dioic acid hydratase in catechol pathway
VRLVRYGNDHVGVLTDGGVVDVSAAVDARWQHTPYAMNDLIGSWDERVDMVRELAASASPQALDQTKLLAPIQWPRHVFAAPLNYRPHVAEMVTSPHAPKGLREVDSADGLGFFLKAPGSISGPADPIRLPPLIDRSFHHEVELGVIVGRSARGISAEQAAAHIFGYVCLLDITLRTENGHQEERVMRKSYETFTPLGPYIVTADEIVDPACLDLRLWVNGVLRQQANTRDLIVGIDELLANASHVLTLRAGDVYATGTPAGVGPIVPGDVVRASVEAVGELELEVTKREW